MTDNTKKTESVHKLIKDSANIRDTVSIVNEELKIITQQLRDANTSRQINKLTLKAVNTTQRASNAAKQLDDITYRLYQKLEEIQYDTETGELTRTDNTT